MRSDLQNAWLRYMRVQGFVMPRKVGGLSGMNQNKEKRTILVSMLRWGRGEMIRATGIWIRPWRVCLNVVLIGRLRSGLLGLLIPLNWRMCCSGLGSTTIRPSLRWKQTESGVGRISSYRKWVILTYIVYLQ